MDQNFLGKISHDEKFPCDDSSQSMSSPNFLYIGTARTGSTWLYFCLRSHPECFVPSAKDVMFFDKEYHRGERWYLKHFAQSTNRHTAIGELSHDYFTSSEALDRIQRFNPHFKLLIILREPFTRTFSNYQYDLCIGRYRGSFSAYCERPHTQQLNSYFQNLTNVLSHFPREQLHVSIYDDLLAEPRSFIRGIYRFLGINDSFEPKSLNERVLPAPATPVPTMMTVARGIATTLRLTGAPNLLGTLKHSSFLNHLLLKQAGDEPPHELHSSFTKRYLPSYPLLEELLDIQLPRSWYGEK